MALALLLFLLLRCHSKQSAAVGTESVTSNHETCGGKAVTKQSSCPTEVNTEWTHNCHENSNRSSSRLFFCEFADPSADLFTPKRLALNWTAAEMRPIPDVVGELLAPWTRNGWRIGPEHIYKAIPGRIPTLPNQHKIWWFQVRNNTLYMDKSLRKKPSGGYAVQRISFAAYYLMQTMKRYPFPDLDFIALQTDECWDIFNGWAPRSFFKTYPPTFSYISCFRSSHISINFDPPDKFNITKYPNREWSDRIDQVVFRGRPGGDCYPNWRLDKKAKVLCGRSRLQKLIDCDYDPLLNISFIKSHSSQKKKHRCFMSMPKQASFKFILYMEGNFGWSYRLKSILQTGSVVLKQVTYSDQWSGHFLEPWVHFIPVDYYLTNLKDQIQWALSHPLEAAQIGRNAQILMSHITGPDFMMKYTAHLMTAYAQNVLNQSAKWSPLRPHAKPVLRELNFDKMRKVNADLFTSLT